MLFLQLLFGLNIKEKSSHVALDLESSTVPLMSRRSTFIIQEESWDSEEDLSVIVRLIH